MNRALHYHSRFRGAAMVELMLAAGVLAVMIPLVFWALAEAGKGFAAARAETRGVWIVPACVDDFRTTRAEGWEGPDGEVRAFGFSREGESAGFLKRADYERGVSRLNETRVGYIAAVRSFGSAGGSVPDSLRRVEVTLEYPARAGAGKRRRLEFHTLVP